MFWRRLLESLAYVAGTVAMIAIVVGFAALVVNFPLAETIIGWIVCGFLSVAVLICACFFINWLFVEPYKNWRRKKTDTNFNGR